MTTPIQHIVKSGSNPQSPERQNNGQKEYFDSLLDIEQADAVMRQTDQYAHWQRISQNNDSQARRIASLVLARNVMVQQHSQGKDVNWSQFNSLTEELRQVGLKLPVAFELTATKQFATPNEGVQQPSGNPAKVQELYPSKSSQLIAEENLLILDLVNDELWLNQTIFAYGNEETSQLPLSEVAKALDFKLDVDGGKATGWFISEDRGISLDAAQKLITIDGQKYPWDSSRISVGDGDIFVDSRLLGDWFPVDFEVSRRELSVSINPREKLPLQLQSEREQERLRLLDQEDMSIRYALTETPYELFSFPVVDFSMSAGVGSVSVDTPDYQAGYSLLAEGDLAYMGAKVFFSGQENNYLRAARVQLNRLDPDAGLLGPLKARRISFGDIPSANLPVLRRPQEERGIGISNADLYRSRDFDTTRFEGNMPPGWDVELYRNNTLVESFRIGGDGRYVFDDVQVFFGMNTFKILSFGPQGQRRVVEEKEINVGSGMFTKGEFEYDISATERKHTILGIDASESKTNDGGRYVGKVGYGLTDTVSVTAGAQSVEFDDTRHSYLQAGINGSFSSFYGQADYLYDTASGSGLSLQGQGAIGPVNVKARHESYYDFIEEDRPNSTLEAKNYLGINGRLPENVLFPPLSYTLSAENTRTAKYDSGKATARLGGRFGPVNLSNVLNWNFSGNENESGRLFNGDFQASGNIGRVRVNGGIRYGLGDNNQISQYRLFGTWPVQPNLTAGASVVQYTGEQKRTSTRANLSWDSGDFILSPSVSYDTEGGFGGFLKLSFSLGRDPVSEDLLMESKKRSGTGGASALVYHDANNNRVFDAEDTPLPEVNVVARQPRKAAVTGADGVASITGLTAYNPVDVEINVDTLEDPFWEPAVPGVSVMPRAGSVKTLEFPVVTTGEIDGTVYAVDSNGVSENLSGVHLEIVNEDGKIVQSTTSEWDGFYLFEKVFPGTYTLRLRPGSQQVDTDDRAIELQVVIGNDGTIASGNDIVFPLSQSNDVNESSTPIKVPSTNAVEGNTVDKVEVANIKESETSIHFRPLRVVDATKNPAAPVQEIAAIESETVAIENLKNETLQSERVVPAIDHAASITIQPMTIVGNDYPTPIPPTHAGAPLLQEVRGTTQTEEKERNIIAASSTDVRGQSHPERSVNLEPTLVSTSPESTNEKNRSRGIDFQPVIQPFAPLGRTDFMNLPVETRSKGRLSIEPTKPSENIAFEEKYNEGTSNRTIFSTSEPKFEVEEPLGDFTVHLASYRTRDAAQTGLKIIAKRLNDTVSTDEFAITEIDLGEKGTWYRVVCGQFKQQADADSFAGRMQEKTEYARTVKTDRSPGADIRVAPLQFEKRMPSPRPQALVAGKYAAMQQRK